LTRTLALSNCLTKDSRTAPAARRAGLEDVAPLGHKSASITLDHLADRLDRLHAQAAVYPACTDAPLRGWRNAKEQVTDLLLVVEVGRLELYIACLPRPRSGGHRSSDLRFR
jgi:hypothetical protein